jgi:hypothetical protein
MVMKLESVVPFSRSLNEYIQMFNLTTADLSQRILGIGDGPASFNAVNFLTICDTIANRHWLSCGQNASIIRVDYELQPGGNEMLVITASTR